MTQKAVSLVWKCIILWHTQKKKEKKKGASKHAQITCSKASIYFSLYFLWFFLNTKLAYTLTK